MVNKSYPFRFVIFVSILSRLALISIQLLTSKLITDHKAIAYHNCYHRALAHDGSSSPKVSSSIFPIYQTIQGFTKWDAQYFLEISIDGYPKEQHLVFLPLLPLVLSSTIELLNRILGYIPENIQDQGIRTERYISSAVICTFLNNFIFFPVAALALYTLTKSLRGNDHYFARKVVLWFCFNPASVFFSSCYSESLFSALVFPAICLIEYQNHMSPSLAKRKSKTFIRKNQTNSSGYTSFITYLPSSLLLSLACLTRSNGLVLISFIGYQFLLKNWTVFRYGLYLEGKLIRILRLIQDMVAFLFLSVVIVLGYILFQTYAYVKFCTLGGTRDSMPEWCEQRIPHSYSSVQSKYWNVGFLRYYQLRQVPNFILALPMMLLVVFGSLRYLSRTKRKFMNRREIIYHLHAVSLSVFCFLMINVQVTTRLISSSCPVIYWYCEDITRNSPSKRRVLRLYFLTYFIVGAILHTSYYPWT